MPFGTNEDDANYLVIVTPASKTGTPAAGSEVLDSYSPATDGFTPILKAAPGVGNSRTFNWLLVRAP